jgi:hypothetical protein
MKEFQFGPEYDKAKIDQELWQRRLAAQQATQALNDLVRSRVNWIADRIITFRSNADETVELLRTSYRYRLKLLQVSPYLFEELAEVDFRAFWDSERELRNDLTSSVKRLACLPRPPRESWRRRLWVLKRKIPRRPNKPDPPPASVPTPASPPPSSS